MKNTIITIASVAALALSANAQFVAISPADLGVTTDGQSVNGTYDVSALFGEVAGTHSLSIGGTATATTGGVSFDLTDSANGVGDGLISLSFSDPALFRLRQGGNFGIGETQTFLGGSGSISSTSTVPTDFRQSNNSVQNISGISAQYGSPVAGTVIYDTLATTAVSSRVVSGNPGGTNNFNFSINTTVPEPSSTALLGLGALGLLVRRKR